MPSLESPSDILYSKSRGIFCVANLGNNTIQLLDAQTFHTKLTFGIPTASQIPHQSPKSIDGFHNACYFNQPHGLAFSSDENYIFVADTDHHSVRIIDIDNQVITNKSMNSYLYNKHRCGLITGQLDMTLLEEPRGICLDQKGNIFVSTKSAIVYLDLEKQQSSIIAGDFKAFGFKDGSLRSAALFDHPDGIVSFFDQSGSNNGLILISDTYNHRIRVLDIATNKVSTLCGNGEPGHMDGPCNKSKLNFPQKIALLITDDSKMLLVTELNDCIRCIDLIKREVFTLCGGFQNKNGLKDGNGKEALLNFPYGIVQINQMKYAVTESDNHSVRILEIFEPEITITINKQSTTPTYQAQQKFSQSTYQMLFSVSQSSASSISDTVLELVQSYFTSKNFQTKEVLAMISKCLCIVMNLKDVAQGQELTILNHSQYILSQIPQSDPQSLSSQQVSSLKLLIDQLNPQPEVKLPGIRSLFQWIQDFSKTAEYYNRSNTNLLDKSALIGSNETPNNKVVEQKSIQETMKLQVDKENGMYKGPHDKSIHEMINRKEEGMAQATESKSSQQTNPKNVSPKKQQVKPSFGTNEKVVSPKINQKQNPNLMKQIDQNKQAISPKSTKQSGISNHQTVSKKYFDEVVDENKKLKEENEQLRFKMAKMKEEFAQMSQMMEEILNAKAISQ